MIALRNVTKRYDTTVAVRDLSLTIERGEFCVIIGPSGCGKSTTLRMINRLIPATEGTILVEGTDIRDVRPEILRRRMGYVIQSIGLFPHMTVAENIGVVPRLLGWDRARRDRRADELLDLFGLEPEEYRGKYPRQLSGGEAQRVGVARALAADPDILLMDEPFGAIDPITRESLQAEFARIQSELRKTIVFVTHDIDEAIRLASRMAILRDGRLVQYDTPENIMTKPADGFVSDFIGTDRALKRLSRMSASGHMRPARSIVSSAGLSEAVAVVREQGYLWVVDGDGALLGWLDRTDLSSPGPTAAEAMTPLDRGGTVAEEATLKEALSRMVQQGLASAPVVDRKGVLKGEIRLRDILEA